MRHVFILFTLLNLPIISFGATPDINKDSNANQREKRILEFAGQVLKSGRVSSLKDVEAVFSIKIKSRCIEKDNLGENRNFCSYTPVGLKKYAIYLESYKAFGEAPMPISRGFLTIGIDTKVTCINKEKIKFFFDVNPEPSKHLPAVDFFGESTTRSEFLDFPIREKLFGTTEFINGCAASIVLNINI